MNQRSSSSRTTRRTFIQSNLKAALALGALPSLVPSAVLGRAGAVAPNSKLAIGCIGNGPQGRGVMSNFLSQTDTQVVALCDVAGRNLQVALNMVNQRYQNTDCATYADYRELLARNDIDAVLIATPDHWHVPVAIDAARAGKDMYLEKPMGLSVAEDQKLRKVIHQKQRIFQFGTQQRSSRQFRQACELVRNGMIGDLKQINVWCSASRPGGSTDAAPIPADLQYERWLGPAPQAPYTLGKCFDEPAPGVWKTWWFNYDYALGFIAGWGVHPLDIAYWGYPQMMEEPFAVEGGGIFPEQGSCNTSVAWDVEFAFPQGVNLTFRGVRNGFNEALPMNNLDPWKEKYGRITDHGTAFEGDDGWVLVDRTGIRTAPESLIEWSPSTGQLHLARSSNHVRNFLDSVRTRRPAICPIDVAVQADILCHVSDIATRVNRPLTWDPVKERFLGDRNANQRLRARSARVL